MAIGRRDRGPGSGSRACGRWRGRRNRSRPEHRADPELADEVERHLGDAEQNSSIQDEARNEEQRDGRSSRTRPRACGRSCAAAASRARRRRSPPRRWPQSPSQRSGPRACRGRGSPRRRIPPPARSRWFPVPSEIAAASAGWISCQPAVSPPSNRIRTSPIVPSVRVSSASSNSTPPIPSDPTSMPSPEQHQAGHSHPFGKQRGADQQQRPGDEDQLGVAHQARPASGRALVGGRQLEFDLLARSRRRSVGHPQVGLAVQ